MKKLCCMILCLVVLAGCGEPTLTDAKNSAEKYINNLGLPAEMEIGINSEYNAVITKFIYDGLYIEPNSVTQELLDLWKYFSDTIVEVGVGTKQAMDNSGYIADCIVYVYDSSQPDTMMLYVHNGEVQHDYLGNATLTQWKKAYTFTSGNYTAGVDFGPGTYDIEAISGTGNVYTDDFSLNAIMGNEQGMNDTINMYEKSYKNVQIADGVTLTVDGVKIRIKLVE